MLQGNVAYIGYCSWQYWFAEMLLNQMYSSVIYGMIDGHLLPHVTWHMWPDTAPKIVNSVGIRRWKFLTPVSVVASCRRRMVVISFCFLKCHTKQCQAVDATKSTQNVRKLIVVIVVLTCDTILVRVTRLWSCSLVTQCPFSGHSLPRRRLVPCGR